MDLNNSTKPYGPKFLKILNNLPIPKNPKFSMPTVRENY